MKLINFFLWKLKCAMVLLFKLYSLQSAMLDIAELVKKKCVVRDVLIPDWNVYIHDMCSSAY